MDNPVFSFFYTLADLIIANMMTFLCCLPVVTIGAALAANHYVTQSIIYKTGGSLIRTYFKKFIEYFKHATIVWLVQVFVLAVLGFNMYLVLVYFNDTFRNILIVLMALLVAFAQEACNDHWGYVWATYGELLSDKSLEELCEKFPTEVGENKAFIQKNWLGRRTSDCAGLIKAYLWYDMESGEIIYENFGFDDLKANELYESSAQKGTLDTIPETPGLGVWHEGHVGIYIGNGYVIHANGVTRGVEMQRLDETKFTKWFEIPWIQYIDETVPEEPIESTEPTESTQ